MHLTNDELATIADILDDWKHYPELRLLQDRIYVHLILADYYPEMIEEIETVYGTAYRICDGLFEFTGSSPHEAVQRLLEWKTR